MLSADSREHPFFIRKVLGGSHAYMDELMDIGQARPYE